MGSLFSKFTDTLGLSGSKASGRNASRQLFQIGEGLKNFTPIRVRSALGDATYDQNGASFNLDPRLAAGAGSAMDFFGNTVNRLNAFDEGDASAKVLALLRQRNAMQFNPMLSDLESRLLAQGRLGLGTGARGDNPEMASFFGAQQDADLNAQLASLGEARTQRQSLMDTATGGLNLALSSALPSNFMQGLFDTAGLRSARDFAAAQIQAGGPALEYKGAEADRGARADFLGNLIAGGAKIAAGGK